MKTQASNKALQSQITSGKMDSLKNKIEKYFKKNTTSNIEVLAIQFDEPKSTIAARVSKLMEEGKIYEKATTGALTIYSYERISNLKPFRAIVYNERLFLSWATRGLKKHGKNMSYELKRELLKLLK